MLMAEHIFYDFAQVIATLQLLIEISVTWQNFIFWQLLGKRKHMFVVMSGKIKSCFLSKMILKVNMMDCSGKRFEFYMRSSYQKPNVAAIYLCRHANSVHARLTCLRILRLFLLCRDGLERKEKFFPPPSLVVHALFPFPSLHASLFLSLLLPLLLPPLLCKLLDDYCMVCCRSQTTSLHKASFVWTLLVHLSC